MSIVWRKTTISRMRYAIDIIDAIHTFCLQNQDIHCGYQEAGPKKLTAFK